MISMDLIYIFSIWQLPVLIAITFHEAAHGYVALCVPKPYPVMISDLTGKNSLFLNQNSLFRQNNSLFGCVGNFAGSL